MSLHARIAIIIFCVVVLFLVGCKGRDKSGMEKDFESLKLGMSERQVIAIMGRPHDIDTPNDSSYLRFGNYDPSDKYYSWHNDIWESTIAHIQKGELYSVSYKRHDKDWREKR